MEKAMAADYSLTPAELAQALNILITADVPAMVWGQPGVGKSDIARQVAEARGLNYVDIRALLLDPVDLRGIPWKDNETGRTRWAPPSFLPPEDSEEGWLLNLEELPSAPPMTQAALYQLALERKCGEVSLPKGARLIACGNRESDRGVVHRMPTPLASRFVHIDVKVDPQAWLNWAMSGGQSAAKPKANGFGGNLEGVSDDMAIEVIFFLKYSPDYLTTFDPKSQEKAFACPRTWSFVSKLVNAGLTASNQVEMALLRGAVGELPAVKFAAFLEVFKHLPSVDQVFKDPTGVDMPGRADILIALCGAICRFVDDTTFDAAIAFAKRPDMRPEIGEFMVDAALQFHPDLQYTKANVQWQAYLNAL